MKKDSRGFVLSFAILIAALFLIVYAQLQADHLRGLREIENETWANGLPPRLARDAMQDLNFLLDQRLHLDQNASTVDLFISGRMPSPLDMNANLFRYQTSLREWGKDANTFIFLDLNSTKTDGNVTGRTNTGYVWKQKLSTDRLFFYPSNVFSRPRTMDINIHVESAFHDTNSSWVLGESGDFLVTLRYSDQNSSHTTISTGWATWGGINTYQWVYEGGASKFTLSIGQVNDYNGAVLLDNNHSGSLSIRYALHVRLDANTTATRAGYDLPLTIQGKDANVNEETQWVYT
jgi:hypothetical protein